MSDRATPIQRHKTAIRRAGLSVPVKCTLRDGLIGPASTVFDYGCGRGQDLELLEALGIPCAGWDPAFRPARPHVSSDVVNLGYVLNVIEDPDERATTLRRAWDLCRQLLVVSAQVLVAGRGQAQVEFGDGVLTRRGTFQKFFGQGELKTYLEDQLGAEAIPANIGVFYLFKDESARQQFLAARYRRRPPQPRRSSSELRFESHRDLLEPFMAAISTLGRLPEPDECPSAAELIERFGTLKRAFAVVRRVTGPGEWEGHTRRCSEDLLVYLALARFRTRPPISALPLGLQRDIRAFFGSYTQACGLADGLLFHAGDADAIDEVCRRSPVGKLLPNALYIHRSALEDLDPLLRVYEGCGRAFLGEVDGANVIKLHRYSGKISYLIYPDFETDPHPPLLRSVKVSLRTRMIDCLDYASIENPPILHRKEAFLAAAHPLYAKFARLTRQEEGAGLLDETSKIGTREGWRALLQEARLETRGHRLMRSKRYYPESE